MKSISISIVILSTVFFLSCGSSGRVTADEKAELDVWIGLKRTDLIKAFGRPAKETPDLKGGEIIVFDTSIVHPKTPRTLYNNGNRGLDNSSSNNYVVTRSRIFFLNSQAIIYKWDVAERQGY